MSPDDPRHGTNAGYTAHLKDKVPPCQPCRAAKNAYMRAYLAAESPDVLTGGHWVCVRGIQRWVAEVDSAPVEERDPGLAAAEPNVWQWRIEDLEFLANTGNSLAVAARRTSSTVAAVERLLLRRGRRDILASLRGNSPRDHNAPSNNKDGLYADMPQGRYKARRMLEKARERAGRGAA